jgi:hypothetical protein
MKRFVIYNQEAKSLLIGRDNKVMMFKHKTKAMEDCRSNEEVIEVSKLNKTFKQQLQKELEANKLESVSKALAKMLELKKKIEAREYNPTLNTKFKIKYNRIFNHYKNLCEQYYY